MTEIDCFDKHVLADVFKKTDLLLIILQLGPGHAISIKPPRLVFVLPTFELEPLIFFRKIGEN